MWGRRVADRSHSLHSRRMADFRPIFDRCEENSIGSRRATFPDSPQRGVRSAARSPEFFRKRLGETPPFGYFENGSDSLEDNVTVIEFFLRFDFGENVVDDESPVGAERLIRGVGNESSSTSSGSRPECICRIWRTVIWARSSFRQPGSQPEAGSSSDGIFHSYFTTPINNAVIVLAIEAELVASTGEWPRQSLSKITRPLCTANNADDLFSLAYAVA